MYIVSILCRFYTLGTLCTLCTFCVHFEKCVNCEIIVYIVYILCTSLTSYFPIRIPLIPLCFLIAIAKISSTILKRYGENGQPRHVPDLSGMALCFSPFCLMLAVGLL